MEPAYYWAIMRFEPSDRPISSKVPVAADAEVPKADSQIDQLARSLAEVKARP